MPLIALLRTARVPPAILSSILRRTYEVANRIDSPPNLVLRTSSDGYGLRRSTPGFITIPPIEGHVQYPFLGWNIAQVASFLDGNTSNTVIDSSTFLGLASVRVSAEYANCEAVAVSVASKDVAELRSLGHGDGVYRGGSRASRSDGEKGVKKGEKAVRKQLGV
ncbi:hypothetical protein BDW69DRAFT_205669 [Aspergillus filifer]